VALKKIGFLSFGHWSDSYGSRVRTLSWLNRFRRLKIRYEHRAAIHLAFLQLGCALIALRFLG